MITKSKPKVSGPTEAVETLLGAAVAQIRQLGSANEASRLFPNGVESIDITLDSGAGTKVELKVSASLLVLGAPGVDDDPHIMFDGNVHAEFNADSHKVIALIAQHDLQQRLPATWKKVEKVLTDGARDLLSAAIFPDVIRSQQPQTKILHFIDIELHDGGPMTPPLPPSPHILSKLSESLTTLKRGGSVQVMVDELSWLIHLVGDIHQPLHCVTRITASHPAPQGDRGGNLFRLKGSPNNLHSVWDSSVSFTHSPIEEDLALSVLNEHTRKSLSTDLNVSDMEKWARTSFNLAKQFAYGPLTENPSNPPKLTATYLKQAERIGRKQAALAGYRLADKLHEVLG